MKIFRLIFVFFINVNTLELFYGNASSEGSKGRRSSPKLITLKLGGRGCIAHVSRSGNYGRHMTFWSVSKCLLSINSKSRIMARV